MILHRNVRFVILCVFLIFFPLSSFALKSDKQKPIYVEADSAVLNHKTGISTYTGHVKLTQGTTVVHADFLVTYTNKQNQLEKAVATGQPASYSTLPDNSVLPFIASAKIINYYPSKGYIELITNAKATQGRDSFAGPQINYDITRQTVTSPASLKGHTSIVIQPNQTEK